MRSSASSALLALAGVLAFSPGCRRTTTTVSQVDSRPLPPGFPRQYLDELMAIADEAAKHCQSILEQPDCYCHNGSHEATPSGDPKKVVPLPARPLGGDKRLRVLHVRCAKHDSPIRFCDSGPLDYPKELPEACGSLDTFSGWSRLPEGTTGEEILTPSAPGCAGHWMQFLAQRKLPGEQMLSLLAFFQL